MAALLEPFLRPAPGLDAGMVPEGLFDHLAAYLDVLLRWNVRTNLTAIREPTAIVQRHFGESLFAARCLAPHLGTGASLLDFGSGAGFPGLPIHLWRTDLRVTLAESQAKKVSFLREATRALGAKVEVWPQRVEEMPHAKLFDAVTLRAVDGMEEALSQASSRIVTGGILVELVGAKPFKSALEPLSTASIPLSRDRVVRILSRRA